MISFIKLGLAIKKLRERRGLSRPETARKAGVTSNYLGMVEAGKRNLSLTTLQKLAEIFEVPEELILCLGSSMQPCNSQEMRRKFAAILKTTQVETWAAIGQP